MYGYSQMNKVNAAIKEALDSGRYCIDELGNVYKLLKKGYKPLAKHYHKKYGRYRTRVMGQKVSTHRLVAYKKFGDAVFNSTMEVHHIDENPLNNHPDNLELVPRGTHLAKYHSGENNKSAKHSWAQIRRLRSMWASGFYTYTALQQIFGLSYPTIKKIVDNQRWIEHESS